MIGSHIRPYIRTRKNIRTMQSLLTSMGPARFTWRRLRESELLMLEERKWRAQRRFLHELRR